MKSLQLLLLALAGGAAQLALAHTELSESVPTDRAILESAPEEVALNFSEPVRLTALSVQLDGAAKRSLGPLPADASAHFGVAVPALEDGHYTVSWRALSEDAHVITGEFMFIVGATGDHSEHTDDAADHSGAH